jgi:hypothetical protein
VASAIANSRFSGYLRELRGLNQEAVESGGLPHSAVELARGHLDGRAGRELRSAVPIAELRRIGAFFTGDVLADQLLSRVVEPREYKEILDPSCGCGDLLLAVARRLPVRADLQTTLEEWGRVLRGVDREPEFVDAARQRLMLLALARGARPTLRRPFDLAQLLPGLRVGNGLRELELSDADLVVLNPPYGRTSAPEGTPWGKGSITEAAVWLDWATQVMRPGVRLLAILPDVLRSGSRYSRWRKAISSASIISGSTSIGQFDALTDIDVFALDLTVVGPDRSQPILDAGWIAQSDDRSFMRLSDQCKVSVGAVVDGRCPHEGPWVPYMSTADGLPLAGRYLPSRRRRFSKRLFAPPFVVLRRTSRPTIDEQRLHPIIVVGKEPVAVENHLLVLEPNGRKSVAACERLIRVLTDPEVTDWLNERIRLRHLTVTALRDVPIAGGGTIPPA